MALHNIGVSEDRIGNRQEALTRLNESLLLFLEIQDPLDIGLTLGDLMVHSRDTGNPGAAIYFGKEAVNSYQQVRRNITGLSPNLQKHFVASKEGTYRQLADLLITQGRLAEAEQILDLLKEEFAMPVEELYPFRKVAINPGRHDESQLRDLAPRLAIAVGLALRSFDTP
jgi:hypothetical protein